MAGGHRVEVVAPNDEDGIIGQRRLPEARNPRLGHHQMMPCDTGARAGDMRMQDMPSQPLPASSARRLRTHS
jgi:hypothetical protein